MASLVFISMAKVLDDRGTLSHSIYYVPNGVSIIDFSGPLEEPRDMAGIPRPVIGCSAHCNQRYNYSLLRNAAAAHKDRRFVFVGPVLVSNSEIDNLRSLARL